MITFLISLLVCCLIASVILYVVRLVLSALGVPQPIARLVYALVVLVLLGVFLNEIGWMGAPHAWRMWK